MHRHNLLTISSVVGTGMMICMPQDAQSSNDKSDDGDDDNSDDDDGDNRDLFGRTKHDQRPCMHYHRATTEAAGHLPEAGLHPAAGCPAGGIPGSAGLMTALAPSHCPLLQSAQASLDSDHPSAPCCGENSLQKQRLNVMRLVPRPRLHIWRSALQWLSQVGQAHVLPQPPMHLSRWLRQCRCSA